MTGGSEGWDDRKLRVVEDEIGTAFSMAFTAALDEREVTMAWLVRELQKRGVRVSPATLSYWRSARSQPERPSSLDALAEIEDILDLPPRHLARFLAPSRRSGPLPKHTPPEVLMGLGPRVSEALLDVGIENYWVQAREISFRVVVEVDADGVDLSLTSDGLVRALKAGVITAPVLIASDGPMTGDVELIPGPGCRVGSQRYQPERGLFAASLLMERPLRVGETGLVSSTLMLPREASPSMMYEHFVMNRVRELVVEARFDPARPPATCEVYSVPVDEDESVARIDMQGRTTAHIALHDFGPGRAGIRWSMQ